MLIAKRNCFCQDLNLITAIDKYPLAWWQHSHHARMQKEFVDSLFEQLKAVGLKEDERK